MKHTYLIIALLGLWACQQQKPANNNRPQDTIATVDSGTNTKPHINYWDTVQVVQIKAYLYRYNRDSSFLIVQPTQKLHAGIAPQYTKTLPKSMTDSLLQKLATNKPYARTEADCFDAHHGFVFYNTTQQIVGHMSICFQCSAIRLKPESLYNFHMQELKIIFKNLGIPLFKNPMEARSFWKEKMEK